MTVVLKMTRVEATQLVARDKIKRSPRNYSLAMIEAEELVCALEVLGVVRIADEPPTGVSR